MRTERSLRSIPFKPVGYLSTASRLGFEPCNLSLRCVGEAAFASALAADVTLYLAVDPSICF